MVERLFIIGLDGATFDLMLPWVRDGHLPVLGGLLAAGAHSPLRSTIPPHTPCAWTSFMTGLDPGKHGLFDFTEPVPGGYGFRFTNASSRRGESLWAILNRHGRRANVVNVPMTWPPEPVNGCLISGLDAPHEASRFMHPAGLQRELAARAIDYRIDLQHMGNMRTDAVRDLCLRSLKTIESERTRAFQYLRERSPAEFEMLVYTATDRVQHHFWHYMDARHDKHDPAGAARYGTAIRDIYVHLDGLIGKLLAQADERTAVMVMSDHGFGPTSSVRVRLNDALAAAGLLHFARQGRRGRALRGLAGRVDRLLRATLSSDLKRRLAARLPRARAWFESADEARIDWSRTTAYTNEALRTSPAIWINRRGRRPQGIVADADLEAALQAVEQALLALRDPETLRPVVSRVHRGRDVYRGPCAQAGPDLIPAWWDDGFLIEQSAAGAPGANGAVRRCRESIIGGVEFAGAHRLEGIFIVAGGPARAGAAFSGARIVDVAPTALYLMGLPIPRVMDGRPLLEAIDADYVAAHPPAFEGEAPAHAPGEIAPAPEAGFTDEESELVAARLRALGYLQ